MKNKFILFTFMFFAAGTLYAKAFNDSASTVVVYPAPPGLTTSGIYSLKANNRDIWTEKFRTTMDIEQVSGLVFRALHTGSARSSSSEFFLRW